MAYEFFYQGAPYSLDPSYGDDFIGYRVPTGNIGAPTSIQTANQIQEVTSRLNEGVKMVELQPLSGEVFDQIPKQHFKEIARMQKMAGAETSIHAPVIEPSGLGKEGWSEADRESAERQIMGVIDKSHELDNKGNIIVNIHASAIAGTEFSPPSPEMIEKYKKQIRENYGREATPAQLKALHEKKMVAINQETKQMIPLERETKYYPEVGEEIRTPRSEIRTVNNTEWINAITNLAFYEKHANETIKDAFSQLQEHILEANAGKKVPESALAGKEQALRAIESGEVFLDNAEAAFRTLYNKAYKYSDNETKEYLREQIEKPWKKETDKLREKRREIYYEKNKVNQHLQSADLIRLKTDLIVETINKLKPLEHQMPVRTPEGKIYHVKPPETYKPIEEFAGDHTSTTFANAALHGYEKYGDKAPILSIENLFPGMAFSRSKQLKKLVDDSRKKFVDAAVKKGKSRGEAKKMSKKLIGVTWDVGHVNILRKGGYTGEDIVKETKDIAPYLKHVHLTDNFGYSDSHLPPGMGNVPTKKILEELEKAGFSGKKIIEAGAFVQHFKISPTQSVLEALGSPMYTTPNTPYWNQTRNVQGAYFSGYGKVFPEQHFSMYGGGFSGMPTELGGQMGGDRSRMGGTPTA